MPDYCYDIAVITLILLPRWYTHADAFRWLHTHYTGLLLLPLRFIDTLAITPVTLSSLLPLLIHTLMATDTHWQMIDYLHYCCHTLPAIASFHGWYWYYDIDERRMATHYWPQYHFFHTHYTQIHWLVSFFHATHTAFAMPCHYAATLPLFYWLHILIHDTAIISFFHTHCH